MIYSVNGNCCNLLSHIFGKNFVKATFLRKKLLFEELIWRNIILVRWLTFQEKLIEASQTFFPRMRDNMNIAQFNFKTLYFCNYLLVSSLFLKLVYNMPQIRTYVIAQPFAGRIWRFVAAPSSSQNIQK